MAGTTRLTPGNVIPGEREVQAKKMVDASPTLPHDRGAVHVELCVVGISDNRGRAVASSSLRRVPLQAVVAEAAAKLHAQLGQGAIDVPMMETGQDVAPSEEAEHEQLRNLLANPDASIAALTSVAAGDEDVCQIPQAKLEKRKRVQAQLSALRPLKSRLRVAHEVHEKANKKYKALVEEEESVMALLLAMQRLTQQAKEARDLNAKEPEEVEVEARTAREGSAREHAEFSNQATFTNEPSAVGGWATECAGKGGEGELQALTSEQFGVQAHQFLPQQQPVQIQLDMRSHHSPSRTKRDNSACPKGRRTVWRRYRLGVRRKTTVGDFFGQSRDSNHIRDRSEAWKCCDGRSMASEAGPHGFSKRPFFLLREVASKRMDEGVVQEWNSWVWAAETDSIEELIFYRWCYAAHKGVAVPRCQCWMECRRVWDLT